MSFTSPSSGDLKVVGSVLGGVLSIVRRSGGRRWSADARSTSRARSPRPVRASGVALFSPVPHTPQEPKNKTARACAHLLGIYARRAMVLRCAWGAGFDSVEWTVEASV